MSDKVESLDIQPEEDITIDDQHGSNDNNESDVDSMDDDSSIHSNSDSYHSMSDNEEPNARKVIDISRYRNGKLLKEVIRKGEGWSTPRYGDELRIHILGKLEDGTVFESSRDRGQLFLFHIGCKEVVAGLDAGIKSMKRGEIAKFTIAPELGYGEQGLPPNVPPNATLIYEIEMFDWKLLDCTKNEDGGVLKRILKSGIGHDNPNMCAKCEVHIIGKYNNQVFDERDVKFVNGQALDSDLIEAIDLAVTRMKKNETCEVLIKPQYAFNESECQKYNIPVDYDQVIYEITLNEFKKANETFEIDENEKLEQSEVAKITGTRYFNVSVSCFQLKLIYFYYFLINIRLENILQRFANTREFTNCLVRSSISLMKK
jgi:FK506-binding protein 4/5